MNQGASRTLGEVARHLSATLYGDPSRPVRGISPANEPIPDTISFLKRGSIEELRALLSAPQAPAAVLVSPGLAGHQELGNVIEVANPLEAVVSLVPLFYPVLRPPPGVSPQAVIGERVSLGQDVSIGAFCVVGDDVTIGDGAILHPHVVLYAGARIGARSVLHSGVIVREHCEVGSDAVIQNGAVIGADGFGYIPIPGKGLQPVPQIGIVQLGSHVDVGANSCIDRATFGTTKIGEGTKIDNQVQIGHNVHIGQHSIVCGQSAIAGSCRIGNGVTLAGSVGIADHLTIADGVRVAARAGVTSDLSKGDYAGHPAVPVTQWRRTQIALRKLPELLRRLNKQGGEE